MEKTMKNLDLSGIDPLRWAETRARVATIESYIAIKHPTDAEMLEHAARLGLGKTQFLGLVRAWQAHGTAVALAGTVRQRTRRQWRSLSKTTNAIMAETLDRLGPDVKLAQATKAIEVAFGAEGLKAPSRQTIWRRLMALRADKGSASGVGDVIVAKCFLELPTLVGTDAVLPVLVLAADPSDGRILASTIGFEQVHIQRITDVLGKMTPATVVFAEGGLGEAFDDLPLQMRIATHGTARRLLARVIGKRLGRLKLRYATAGKSADSLLTAKSDQALSIVDAMTAIEDAIRQHNSQRAANR
jgi:hypothetical protein